MYSLKLDREMCISCGTCIENCPEIFEFAEDGTSSIKGVETSNIQEMEMDDLSCTLDAAVNCPVNCIHIYEDGEEIEIG